MRSFWKRAAIFFSIYLIVVTIISFFKGELNVRRIASDHFIDIIAMLIGFTLGWLFDYVKLKKKSSL